jgi:hypothetical protein
VAPRLVESAELDETRESGIENLYGAFRSRASARTALRELAKAYRARRTNRSGVAARASAPSPR